MFIVYVYIYISRYNWSCSYHSYVPLASIVLVLNHSDLCLCLKNRHMAVLKHVTTCHV